MQTVGIVSIKNDQHNKLNWTIQNSYILIYKDFFHKQSKQVFLLSFKDGNTKEIDLMTSKNQESQ